MKTKILTAITIISLMCSFKSIEEAQYIVKGTKSYWSNIVETLNVAAYTIDSSNVKAETRVPLRNRIYKVNEDFIKQLTPQIK